MYSIYLDLNVFDQIEKHHKLSSTDAEPYKFLLHCLKSEDLYTHYSHAHITDLVQAYKPEDTKKLEGHLKNIGDLANDVCICLSEGDVDVTIAEVDIFTYFNFVLEASKNIVTTEDIMAQFGEYANDESPISPEMEKALEHPLIQKLYPKTFKTRMNKSILEDNIEAPQRMHDDPALFRVVKKLMNPANMNEYKQTLPPGEKLDKQVEKYLKGVDFEARLDKYGPQGKTSDNEWYDKIVNLYYRTDFKGFKTDKTFTSLMQDAEHTFYAAHFDIFITNDKGCHYKASEVYSKLGLGTKVFTAKEFYDYAFSNFIPEL